MAKLSEVEALLRDAIIATQKYFDAVKQLPPTEALIAFWRLDQAKKAISGEVKLLNALHQNQQYSVIPDIMKTHNIRTYAPDDIPIRFGMQTRTSAKIIDKPLAFEWLRSEGQGDIIQETVNAQTLGAFAGNYMDETGKDLPEGIFEVKQHLYATVTKVRATKKAA